MTDEKMEQVKTFFSNFSDLEDFKKRYISVNNPQNADALIDFFNNSHSNSDTWELYKYLRSSESLRIDKIIGNKQNITINDILELTQKYDLNQYKRIIISLDNKDYNEIEKLATLNLDIFIKVNGDKSICSLEEFLNMRNFFNSFKMQYSNYQLTNLEKITLAYDYTKFFSYNIENSDRLTDSRSIAKSIKTGFIVCEGYCRIFCQLLKEMGIDSHLLFIKPNQQEKGGHVRVIANVKDDKYNVIEPFIFDPTWDSNMDMALVQHEDKTISYEIKKYLKENDTILENMPSDIRYLFYMVPIYEYQKYFKDEEIEKIEKYATSESIVLNDQLMDAINFNDYQSRQNIILELLPKILIKTKKIEGYTDEQIEKYIQHAINIMNQDRFGRMDKYNKSNEINHK